MKTKKQAVSVEALQNKLWETLTALKEKKIDVSQANAITMAAKEICNITRLELQYRALSSTGAPLKVGDVPMLDKK